MTFWQDQSDPPLPTVSHFRLDGVPVTFAGHPMTVEYPPMVDLSELFSAEPTKLETRLLREDEDPYA